jgi:hypothetical protein
MSLTRILALSGISIAAAFAQAPAPAPAKAKPAAAKPAATKFVPPKTPWGEPDLQGLWPLTHLISVPLVRRGEKAFLTDEEVAAGQAAADRRLANAKSGAIPVADASNKVMRQTSLIQDPPNGQFPELTDYGKKLQEAMRSSYKPGQTVFDKIEDFAAWDRCITRGMPVSMETRNYNVGIKIVQAPGYVTVFLEMAHEARVIPTFTMPMLPTEIKQWLGEPRGHWEGNTLVVVSKNFNGLVGQTSAGVPGSPGPLQPETTDLVITERFTRTAADTIEFSMKVEDPAVMKSSYTVAYPMYLDNSYEFYEYACHEGNTAVRNYIETSRFERANPAPAAPAKPAAAPAKRQQ